MRPREGRRDRKCERARSPALTGAARRAAGCSWPRERGPGVARPRPAMGLLSDPVRRRALARLVLRLNAPLWYVQGPGKEARARGSSSRRPLRLLARVPSRLSASLRASGPGLSSPVGRPRCRDSGSGSLGTTPSTPGVEVEATGRRPRTC